MIYNPSKSLRNRSMVLRQHTSKGHDLAEAVTWRGATHKSLLKSLLQEMWLADSLPVMPWNTPQKPSSGYSAPVPEHWGTINSGQSFLSDSLSRWLVHSQIYTEALSIQFFLFSFLLSEKAPNLKAPFIFTSLSPTTFFFCTSYSILVSTSQRT